MQTLNSTRRDIAEIARSEQEARNIRLEPSDVARYINPPADTPFALEFAFHLLGNIAEKTVLDVGCGTGETLVPILRRGACAIGIDISPDLITLADRRLAQENLRASLRVCSAYETGLPAKSVDVIFAMAVLHHLDLPKAREEFQRVLRDDGYLILREPIRYSAFLRAARHMFPQRDNISEYEHPLTIEETDTFTTGFLVSASRYFRLPFIPVFQRLSPSVVPRLVHVDRRLLTYSPWLSRFATVRVMKLIKANGHCC